MPNWYQTESKTCYTTKVFKFYIENDIIYINKLESIISDSYVSIYFIDQTIIQGDSIEFKWKILKCKNEINQRIDKEFKKWMRQITTFSIMFTPTQSYGHVCVFSSDDSKKLVTVLEKIFTYSSFRNWNG